MWYMGSINSIPSESLCSLEAGVTRDQAAKYKLDSKPHNFQLLSHTLLLIPIEHAPSNQINEVMTLNPDHNTNYKLSYVVTTGRTSSCFLVEFFPWKKIFPFTSPSQLANSPSRLQGSHPREVPCDLKG